MKYLNLTKGFNPYNALEEDCIQFESFFFNGGEPHIKLDLSIFNKRIEDYVRVSSRLTSMNDFMMLIVATEALNNSGWAPVTELFIPYFPGGRQDRRMVDGEPLSAKVFARIINGYKFDNVVTFDNHSDVSTALIAGCDNLDNHKFVKKCIEDIDINRSSDKWEHQYLISPDAGASKKIFQLAKYLGNPHIVNCHKHRNINTGQLADFEVYTSDLEGKDCIIVDDICDGGGTFIGLAKELKKKNAGDIYLIVSHGIFSKPLKELKPYFKKIYTTDSWRSEFGWMRRERDDANLVEIVKFKDFM